MVIGRISNEVSGLSLIWPVFRCGLVVPGGEDGEPVRSLREVLQRGAQEAGYLPQALLIRLLDELLGYAQQFTLPKARTVSKAHYVSFTHP